jgi:RimJ/RimL family protein N-acetyltransferase
MKECVIKVVEPVKNRDGLFGIAMLPIFLGKGNSMEATRFTVDHVLRALGVQRVSSSVSERNEAVIAVYKKCQTYYRIETDDLREQIQGRG